MFCKGTERDKNANYTYLNYFYNVNSHVISYEFLKINCLPVISVYVASSLAMFLQRYLVIHFVINVGILYLY